MLKGLKLKCTQKIENMLEKWMSKKKKCHELQTKWKILKEFQKNYKERMLILKNR